MRYLCKKCGHDLRMTYMYGYAEFNCVNCWRSGLIFDEDLYKEEELIE